MRPCSTIERPRHDLFVKPGKAHRRYQTVIDIISNQKTRRVPRATRLTHLAKGQVADGTQLRRAVHVSHLEVIGVSFLMLHKPLRESGARVGLREGQEAASFEAPNQSLAWETMHKLRLDLR